VAVMPNTTTAIPVKYQRALRLESTGGFFSNFSLIQTTLEQKSHVKLPAINAANMNGGIDFIVGWNALPSPHMSSDCGYIQMNNAQKTRNQSTRDSSGDFIGLRSVIRDGFLDLSTDQNLVCRTSYRGATGRAHAGGHVVGHFINPA
jgi:hypothetical protein